MTRTQKKVFSYLLLGLTASFFLTPLRAAPQKYQLLPKKSKIQWEGKKVTGSHNGTIRIAKGFLLRKGKSIQGNIVIDMASIKCRDIKDKKYNQKLVQHLKSEDFFHVKKYKRATLKILKFKKKKGNIHELIGKFTIRGVSQKVKFPAKFKFSKNQLRASGKIKLDRTKFNIKYKSGKFYKSLGDKLIYDDFIIRFSILATSS